MSASGSSLGGIAAAASSGAAGPPAMASDDCSAPSRSPIASIPVPTSAIAPTSRAVPTTNRRRGRLEPLAAGSGSAAATGRHARECGCCGGPDEGWGRRQVAPALVLTLVAGEGIVHVGGPPDGVRSLEGRTDAGPASDPEARRTGITRAYGRCKDDLKRRSGGRVHRPQRIGQRSELGHRDRARPARRSGSHTTKLAPCPGSEATLTVPPCASPICRTRARPRPCPSPSGVGSAVAPSPAEDEGLVVARDAAPDVANAEPQPSTGPSGTAMDHRARGSHTERVRDEVRLGSPQR